jgi:glycosyltransferase involved in cell wall biosynthesis
VVDNASTDGTAEMVRAEFPGVELIVNPENEGIGGWNRAFAAGRGEWFLVLDDDCYLDGDGLRRALAAAQEAGADLASFTVDASEPGQVFSDLYRTGLLAFWGCAALISRRAIAALGGFDARLFIWAHEMEFTMRLLDRGFAHLHLPEVRALHMKPLPGPLGVAANSRNVRNFAYVAAKLLRPRDAVLAVGSLLVRVAIETVMDRRFAAGLPAIAEGCRDGLAARSPVRPAVSRLYRRNFHAFSSTLRPWMRLRHVTIDRRVPGTDFQQRYWSARPRLYPRHAAVLRVPGAL